MVSPSSRRRAVTYVVGQGLGSAAQSCRALGLARSSFYRRSRVSPERAVMKQRIIELSEAHPRYGYRRIGALLRREANGSIRSAYSGFGARKTYRCARTNARNDGLEYRRHFASGLNEPIRSGVGTSFMIRPRQEAHYVS
jgi:hypothetical protein